MSILARKKQKHPEKRQKNDLLKAIRKVNIKMSAKGAPVFTFTLPRGVDCPSASRQLRHCMAIKCAINNRDKQRLMYSICTHCPARKTISRLKNRSSLQNTSKAQATNKLRKLYRYN